MLGGGGAVPGVQRCFVDALGTDGPSWTLRFPCDNTLIFLLWWPRLGSCHLWVDSCHLWVQRGGMGHPEADAVLPPQAPHCW